MPDMPEGYHYPMIRVVNRRQYRGTNGVYVGRPTSLGNPFLLVEHGGGYTRDESVNAYEVWLRHMLAIKDVAVCEMMNYLWTVAHEGDLDLVCYCAPERCHADVIKKVLEEHL